MKLFGFALVSSLVLVSSLAHALTSEEIAAKGQAALGDNYLLNPIKCVDASGNIALIYSNDFRESSIAYVQVEGVLKNVGRTSVKIEEVSRDENGDSPYYSEKVKLNGQDLVCAESKMQLE